MLTRRQALHRLSAASAGLALAGVPFYRVSAQSDEIVVGSLLELDRADQHLWPADGRCDELRD